MRPFIILSFLSILLSYCGRAGEPNDQRTATSCTIQSDVLACTDGTVYSLPKQPANGKDGSSCGVQGQSVVCSDGSSYAFPVPTLPQDGVDGKDGSSCSVSNGVITCTDGTHYVIPTPRDGPEGPAGPAGRDSIVRIIDPCGPHGSGVDELVFVLSTGQLVVWYQNVGLVALKDGNYRTTDQQQCNFKVLNGEYVGAL